MTELQRRYRALLRILPRWYRAQREEEMVATFMAGRCDPDDRDLGWPGWRESRAVLALALSTRVAARHGPHRALALGDIVRLAAVFGLLAQVPRAVAAIVHVALGPGSVRAPGLTPYHLVTATQAAATAALVGIVVGRTAVARACSAGAVAMSLAALTLSLLPAADGLQAPMPWHIAALCSPVWVAIACLLIGFTQEAPISPSTGTK